MKPTPSLPTTILLAEDHETIARLTADLVRDLGYQVMGPTRFAKEARRLAKASRPHLALVDLRLADGSGLDLIRDLRAMNIPCAIVSAHSRFASGGDFPSDIPWVQKPLAAEQLSLLVRNSQGDAVKGDV